LNEQLGWNVQDEDVDTIAGYIMKGLGRTERVGGVIATPYGRIRVENMAQVWITQVAILPLANDSTRSASRLLCWVVNCRATPLWLS